MTTEVADWVVVVEGSAVNWTLIADGDALTLVDARLPVDIDDLPASISEIGHRRPTSNPVLVTHVDQLASYATFWSCTLRSC